STTADCIPGSPLETRPLYRLPTTPRLRSRAMNTSATWSSSRIATRVSWALEEMIISLVMPDAPCRRWTLDTGSHTRSCDGRRGCAHKARHRQSEHDEGADTRHQSESC